LAHELKLFDHLQKLEELTKNQSDHTENIQHYIANLVDRMYIDKEIDRILDANFLKVIKDINELVEREYVHCTGNKPKLAIFDELKIGDKVAASLEKDEVIAKDFMKKYRSKSSRELADAFRRQYETPTFESMSAVNQTDVFTDSLESLETLLSSYPIEMYKD
jgi:microsomal dipeptidase-like Zn-dependent dipeptidase